jgi:hypothetical protein
MLEIHAEKYQDLQFRLISNNTCFSAKELLVTVDVSGFSCVDKKDSRCLVEYRDWG